jgi:hypothetical protein
MEYFNVDMFLKIYQKKNVNIETKHISDWIECSVRYIQKYADINNVPYHRIHGRKYYVWNEETIKELSICINRKHDKKEEIEKREVEEPKPKQKIIQKPNYRTLNDLVNELYGETDKYKLRIFQRWCKIFDVPFQYHFGRKYYIIFDEIKEIFIKLETDKTYYYEVFPKKPKLKIVIEKNKNMIRGKDIDTLFDIYKEEYEKK